jgi:hypothetical protein
LWQLDRQDFQQRATFLDLQDGSGEHGDETAGGQQTPLELNRNGKDACPWNTQSARTKDVRHQASCQRIRRWQSPAFVDQIGKLHASATSPRALAPDHDVKLFVKEHVSLQIVIDRVTGHSAYGQLGSALAQRIVLHGDSGNLRNVKDHTWILS